MGFIRLSGAQFAIGADGQRLALQRPGPRNPVLPFANTVYFRSLFVAPDNVSVWSWLRFKFLLDGGAIFYLNGQRVAASDSPVLPFSYNDFLGGDLPDFVERTTLEFGSTNVLRAGTNVIAVELHEAGDYYWSVSGMLYRPDMYFSAGLEGRRNQIGPLRIVREGNELLLWWTDENVELEYAESLAGEWHTQPVTGQSHRHAPLGGGRFFRLRERTE